MSDNVTATILLTKQAFIRPLLYLFRGFAKAILGGRGNRRSVRRSSGNFQVTVEGRMEKIESPTSARPEREREGRRSKQVSRKISECKDSVRFKRKNKV